MPRAAPSDFEQRKYDLDRAHELELNRFTHGLEVERLKLLFLLNGGAATAWFTFAGKRVEGLSGFYTLTLAFAPTLLWLMGLVLAAQAAREALSMQRNFAKAYHRRRRAAEQAWIAGSPAMPADEATLRAALKASPDETLAACYHRLADEAADEAQVQSFKVESRVQESIYAFAGGGAVASLSFASTLPAWLDKAIQGVF